jgi:hypothetical protein
MSLKPWFINMLCFKNKSFVVKGIMKYDAYHLLSKSFTLAWKALKSLVLKAAYVNVTRYAFPKVTFHFRKSCS